MISLKFGNTPEPTSMDEKTLWVFPFRTDVSRLFEFLPDDSAYVGWNALSMREFTDSIHQEIFPQFQRLKPASRFGLVHRILLESDFMLDYDELRRKTGIAESLVRLFALLDETGILNDQQIQGRNRKSHRKIP